MKNKHGNYSGPFKAKVALAAIKGDKTLAALSNEFQVHSTQITQWKKQLKDSLLEIFSLRRNKKDQKQQELMDQLYKQANAHSRGAFSYIWSVLFNQKCACYIKVYPWETFYEFTQKASGRNGARKPAAGVFDISDSTLYHFIILFP